MHTLIEALRVFSLLEAARNYLKLCHADTVDTKEDTVDSSGSEDRVQHPLEVSPHSLTLRYPPDHPGHAGLLPGLLQHLHRVQGVTTHQTSGASHPPSYHTIQSRTFYGTQHQCLSKIQQFQQENFEVQARV